MESAADSELFVRLYIDADITPKLAGALRERGHDAVSAHEIGKAEVSDEEQMAFAAEEGRALLTCNAQDFAPLFEAYWLAQKAHSGVLVSQQLELGEMLRRTEAFLDTVAADDMRNNWRNLAEFARRSTAG